MAFELRKFNLIQQGRAVNAEKSSYMQNPILGFMKDNEMFPELKPNQLPDDATNDYAANWLNLDREIPGEDTV